MHYDVFQTAFNAWNDLENPNVQEVVEDWLKGLGPSLRDSIRNHSVAGECLLLWFEKRQKRELPAACGRCGGWHSYGGMSHHADGPDGCDCRRNYPYQGVCK